MKWCTSLHLCIFLWLEADHSPPTFKGRESQQSVKQKVGVMGPPYTLSTTSNNIPWTMLQLSLHCFFASPERWQMIWQKQRWNHTGSQNYHLDWSCPEESPYPQWIFGKQEIWDVLSSDFKKRESERSPDPWRKRKRRKTWVIKMSCLKRNQRWKV